MTRTQRVAARMTCMSAALLALCASANGATISLRFETASNEVAVSDSFDVNIIADISEPIVGFGFELMYDAGKFALNEKTTSSQFIPLVTSDEDFLGGLTFPDPISGSNVLLGTATFTAIAEGTGTFSADMGADSLTHGFAEIPVMSFATFAFDNELSVTAAASGFGGVGPSNDGGGLPEPASVALLTLGALAVGSRKPRRR